MPGCSISVLRAERRTRVLLDAPTQALAGGGAVNTQICVASAAVQEAPLPPLDAAGRA